MSSTTPQGSPAEQDRRVIRSLALTVAALGGLMVVLIVAARIITA
jgi:hypothetical protein